jgi:hypothetical protein
MVVDACRILKADILVPFITSSRLGSISRKSLKELKAGQNLILAGDERKKMYTALNVISNYLRRFFEEQGILKCLPDFWRRLKE